MSWTWARGRIWQFAQLISLGVLQQESELRKMPHSSCLMKITNHPVVIWGYFVSKFGFAAIFPNAHTHTVYSKT